MRKFTFIFSILITLLALELNAQHPGVQGFKRIVAKSSTRGTPPEIPASIDFKEIKFWTGQGKNSSAMVVKWNQNKEKQILLVWGYRWENEEEGTGEAMLKAIAKNDPRFYIMTSGRTQFGIAVGGLGFDIDNDNEIALIYNDKEEKSITDGLYETPKTDKYEFDSYKAKDTDDLWLSGWEKGYWSYWIAKSPDEIYTYSYTGASQSKLSDGTVNGWCFVSDMSNWYSNDMSGTVIYINSPENTEPEEEERNYTNGTFILNEDWFGHQNSTLNYITKDGEWIYRAFQKENPGMELGATAQYGTVYGDRIYIMAKQAQDPGASVKGGRLTVCDAKTLKCIKQFENISTDENGNSNADGRGFLGIDEKKAYIGTSNGIYILNTENLEITGQVKGSENESKDGYGSLYSGQIGTMVRVNEDVFAVHQKKGIMVIDAENDTVKSIIGGPDKWGYGSIVMSKDGNLWASVANPSGNGQSAEFMMKIIPSTCDTTRINMPEGIYAPANSWYAWTPDCFCASTQNNVIYWNGGQNSWFSNQTIYKYDIDNNEFGKFIDFTDDQDKWIIYGCSFRVDPVTDNSYVSLYHSFTDPTFVTRTYDNEGKMVKEYQMISNYWFPSIPIFPDKESPVITKLDDIRKESGEPFIISLASIATDADNMQAAIVKTVKDISDKEIADAVIKNGDLNVMPLGKTGQTDITIGINSNGKLAESMISIYIGETTGINNIESERTIYYYDGNIYFHGYKGCRFMLYNMSGQVVRMFTVNEEHTVLPLDAEKGMYVLKGSNENQSIELKIVHD